MPQESKEKLRRFEQKLRKEGSDGFADGPRPWEQWDESGHQANNRIWEGSSRRIYTRRRKNRSLGYRLLSVLAFLALTTLLVGIGGVYYSHTQTQQLAQRKVQPLPAALPPVPSATSTGNEAVTTTAAKEPHDLNILSAPAAGSGSAQDQALAVIETTPAVDAAIPATDDPMPTETFETAAAAPEATPPATNEGIDSVSIETVVTEKSVTTTVYTRHPQQTEAEIVAAIETLPPTFASGVVDAPQQLPDVEPPSVHISNDEAMTTPPSTMPLPALQAEVRIAAVDDLVTASADEQPLDAPADNPATAATEEDLAAAAAEAGSEANVTEALAETTVEVTAVQPEAAADVTPAEQTEDATTVAAAEVSRMAAVPEVSAEASNDSAATVTPVAKTGDWVINLASYTWKSTASRKLALFQQQGVDGEIFAVTINDKPMYRIRVTGFESSRAAKAGIPAIEEALDLEGAWISRR